MIRISSFSIALLLIGFYNQAHAVQTGKAAPNFTLQDQYGKTHTLANYKGKIVILEWTNPGCPYVQRHYKAQTFQKITKQFKDKPVIWLAINSSHFITAREAQKWAKKQHLTYPTLLDPNGDVGKLYEAKTTPQMVVIDAKGIIQYYGAIDDDPYGDKVKTTNYVKKAITALLQGKIFTPQETKSYGCSVKYKTL